jgi:hypothetical protein
VFHVELRRFPHVARAFNLTREQLEDQILAPWVAGSAVHLNDQRWTPDKARLSIYEGPALPTEQMGLGRGWANVTRAGTDVTSSLLGTARREAAAPPAVEELKRAILDRGAGARIALKSVIQLAGEQHPQARLSERLAIAERAVWELLHERRVGMLREQEPVQPEQWSPVLLSWEAWEQAEAAQLEVEETRGR